MSDDKNTEEQFGIPESMKVKPRPYNMSDAALDARKKNAQLSTGPNTEDGKAASSRNSWKHGLYSSTLITGMLGRPCRSSCDKYSECSLITDGQVEPGDDCLDKVFVAEAFGNIIEAIRDGKHDSFQDMAALEMAGGFDVLRMLKESIKENGVIIKHSKLDVNGKVLGYEYKLNPAVAAHKQYMELLNMTPADHLMTAKEIEKAKSGKKVGEAVKSLASLMGEAKERKIDT
jgi:hypothetical protein